LAWSRARRTIGSAVELLGVAIPAVAVAVTAYAHDAKMWAVEVALACLAAMAPIFAPKASERLRERSRLDAALKIALEHLVTSILVPPKASNPQFPAVRATVFVPDGENLRPRYRIDSSADASVAEFGDGGFSNTRSFRREAAFAGQTWVDGQERYNGEIRALDDFDGDDAARMSGWKSQWQAWGARAPEDWSAYSQRVRSIWTFAIPGDDPANPIAVISVDSTFARAFDSSDPPAPSFQCVNTREAIAGGIAATVLLASSANKRGLVGQLRSAFGGRKAASSLPPAPPVPPVLGSHHAGDVSAESARPKHDPET
jgi:hypothetical protein